MKISLDPGSVADYQRFLQIKQLPQYKIAGRSAWFPDEYAQKLGLSPEVHAPQTYTPSPWLFDYQAAIAERAIEKQKFSCFIDCGLGKTAIMLEFARHSSAVIGPNKIAMIVSPLMVIDQTLAESERFYPGMKIERVSAANLPTRLNSGVGGIIITNYEALEDDMTSVNLGALMIDESSSLKSHYGKWGQTIISLGKGLTWKLALTGTPAPNDRIEYANHAVFMDAFPTVNSFLARYFINRGQTNERWELKPYALEPFYRHLSHWCIFMSNPATYGWKDNATNIPPIHVHIHEVSLTDEQQGIAYDKTGALFADNIGGITSRSVLSQVAKGNYRGKRIESLKPAYIKRLVESWPNESTIIWCKFNDEQDGMAELFPDAANIDGSTPHEKRRELIAAFKSGEKKIIISKPRVLGFGLNLQIATRQIFSGLQDSYEEYYQAVKRSNRVGSTKPLNVHIPVTDIERPMIETVLRKAKMVESDTAAQERIFRKAANSVG